MQHDRPERWAVGWTWSFVQVLRLGNRDVGRCLLQQHVPVIFPPSLERLVILCMP